MDKLSEFGYTKEMCKEEFPKVHKSAIAPVLKKVTTRDEFISEMTFRNDMDDFIRNIVATYNTGYHTVLKLLRKYTKSEVRTHYVYDVPIQTIDKWVTFRGENVPLYYACKCLGFDYRLMRLCYNVRGRECVESRLALMDSDSYASKTILIEVEGKTYTMKEASRAFNVPYYSILTWSKKHDTDAIAKALLYGGSPHTLETGLIYEGKLCSYVQISLDLGRNSKYISGLVKAYGRAVVQKWLDDGTIKRAIKHNISVFAMSTGYFYKGEIYSRRALALYLDKDPCYVYNRERYLSHAEIQEALDSDRLDIIETAGVKHTVTVYGRRWGLYNLAKFLQTYPERLLYKNAEEVCDEFGYKDRLKFESISPDVTHITADLWTYKCPECNRTVLCRTNDLINFTHNEDWCKDNCVDEEV